MGSTRLTNFDCHCKSVTSRKGTKKLVFCCGYNEPTLFLNLEKRYLTYRERGTL